MANHNIMSYHFSAIDYLSNIHQLLELQIVIFQGHEMFSQFQEPVILETNQQSTINSLLKMNQQITVEPLVSIISYYFR